MRDTKRRSNPRWAPASDFRFEFAPAEGTKPRSEPRTRAKRSLEFSFGGIRRQHGSRKFVAIGEDQFFHLHPLLPVFCGGTDDGDLVAGFVCAPAPASP